MNIKNVILVPVIVLLITILNSCSSRTVEPNNVVETLKKQNDSLIRANNALANEVTIYVVDSTMQQYVHIPDHVKTAWWEYEQTKKAAEIELAEVETANAVVKKSEIEKAQQEQKARDAEADKKYNEIEKTAQNNFAKNSKEFLLFVSNPENIDYFSPYLGSSDSYWSLSISFNFSNMKNTDKMPDGFQQMLAPCKEADSVKNQVKAYSKKVFETRQKNAENAYEAAMAAPSKIAADKINAAYMLYLIKIK